MRRFGQPDTSLMTFGRLLADTTRHHAYMKLVLVTAIFVAGYPLAHGRLDVVVMVLVIYALGLTVTYLKWRYLVRKGTWWLM